MAKIIAALVLALLFVLPAGAQESEEEWASYINFFDVMRFQYPTSWELDDRWPYDRMRTYSRVDLHGPNDQTIEMNVRSISMMTQFTDFNLPFDTDFETFIDEAVRWRWPDYELVELGEREFIRYTEERDSITLNYFLTYLDTGILGTVTAISAPDDLEEATQIAEGVAASLEYVGDFPVDPSCTPLSGFVRFSIPDGTLTVARSPEWNITFTNKDYLPPNARGIEGQKDEDTRASNAEQDCFGVPRIRYSLTIFQEPFFASLSAYENSMVENMGEEFISVEHLTLQGNPAFIVNTGAANIIDDQWYVGNLENGNTFILNFRSIPGQTERWQELAIEIIESIEFEPSE